MDRYSSTLATVAANVSLSVSATASSASAWSHAVIIVFVNCLATILCACAMTCWVVALLEGRRQRRELRDKVGSIVSAQYWPVEGEVSRLLREVETMRSAVLFRDVTAFDVLAYQYRFRRQPADDAATNSRLRTPSAFQTLRRVERLLDSLALQVPVRGRCPDRVVTPFGRTLCGLARTTAAVWSDEQAPTVSRLVRFFGGAAPAAEFDAARASDVVLEQRVESRVPYVDALRLYGDHFVLADMELNGDVGAFDVRAKVRYVDERLTEPDVRLSAANNWRQMLGVYRAACDLCVGAGLIQTRSTLPDFTVESASDDARVTDCVVVLRHLVRLMCGVRDNANRLGSDDQFFGFVAALHDAVYGWNNGGAASSSSMLACIERSRANIVAYASVLTVDQIFIAPELTRSVLERAEAELYRHLDYLTVRRVRMTRRIESADQGRGEGPSGTSAAASEVRQLEEGAPHLGDSETSIYTMAASYMSPPRRPAAAVAASPKRYDAALSGSSAERMSLLSGASSMYATAASLSSATNDGDSLSARQSPGLARCSLPHAALPRSTAVATVIGSTTSDADDDYFETPV